jgi:dTMP kinase
LDLSWCQAADKGLPAPDAVIYMKVKPEEAAKRGGYGQERYEKADTQQKVGAIFEKLKQPSWLVGSTPFPPSLFLPCI